VLQVKLAAAVLVVLFTSSPAHAGEDDPFDGGTITFQTAIGSLSGFLGGAAAGAVGLGVGYAVNPKNITTSLVGAFLGFATGATIGVTFGVDYAGDDRGANGTLLGTSLGMAAGLTTFISFEAIMAKLDKEIPNPIHALVGIVTCVGGPIIGYHLSADDRQQKRFSLPIVGFAF
jgi:hypothetical protein